jgi:nuclear GTP-binding protein
LIIQLALQGFNLSARADLVPREVAEAWLKYLREEAPTVAFKSSTQRQASNLAQRRLPGKDKPNKGSAGSESLGADTLIQLLKNYARNAGLKTAITVGTPTCTIAFLVFCRP